MLLYTSPPAAALAASCSQRCAQPAGTVAVSAGSSGACCAGRRRASLLRRSRPTLQSWASPQDDAFSEGERGALASVRACVRVCVDMCSPNAFVSACVLVCARMRACICACVDMCVRACMCAWIRAAPISLSVLHAQALAGTPVLHALCLQGGVRAHPPCTHACTHALAFPRRHLRQPQARPGTFQEAAGRQRCCRSDQWGRGRRGPGAAGGYAALWLGYRALFRVPLWASMSVCVLQRGAGSCPLAPSTDHTQHIAACRVGAALPSAH